MHVEFYLDSDKRCFEIATVVESPINGAMLQVLSPHCGDLYSMSARYHSSSANPTQFREPGFIEKSYVSSGVSKHRSIFVPRKTSSSKPLSGLARCVDMD